MSRTIGSLRNADKSVSSAGAINEMLIKCGGKHFNERKMKQEKRGIGIDESRRKCFQTKSSYRI